MAFVWRYIRRYRGRLAVALVFLTGVSVGSLLFPFVLRMMVEQVLSAVRPRPVDPAVTILLVVGMLTTAMFGYLAHTILQQLGFLLRDELRRDMFITLLQRPLAFHRRQQTGELTARAMEDIGRLQPVYGQLIGPVFQHSLVSLGCVMMMTAISVQGTMAAVALLILPVPVMVAAGRAMLRQFASGTEKHALSNALMEEMLTAIREVKIFRQEEAVMQRYGGLQQAAERSERASTRLQAVAQQSVVLVLSLILTGVFLASTNGWLPREWSVGDSVAFYLYAYALMMSSVSIGKAVMQYHGIIGALERTRELMSPEPRMQAGGGIGRDRLDGGVEISGVSFSYDESHPVLRNLSITIAPGTWHLITGPSGCGKSTIANLLTGLYEPTAGQILIDGIDIGAWEMASLRARIGYVPQETVLFHGTIRENIVLGNPRIEEDRLREILRVAGVDRFLAEMPHGLDTRVGERGYTLSGGQKARTAIARALVIDPDILILDEANAMLETETERALWLALHAHRKDRTTIIITHHWEVVPPVCTRTVLDGPFAEPAGTESA